MVSMFDLETKYPVGVRSIADPINPRFVIEDEYGGACAEPIYQNGIDTHYDMCYRKMHEPNGPWAGRRIWVPVGTVSRNWTPISTSSIANEIRNDLNGQNLFKSTQTKLAPVNSSSTTHKVSFMIDRPIEMPFCPRDAGTRFTSFNNTSKEVYYPRLVLWNGYTGCCGLRGQFGLWRMICLNGMEIPFLTGKVYNLHTITGVKTFAERFLNQDWKTACDKLTYMLKDATHTEMTEEMMDELLPSLTGIDIKSWEEYPDQTAKGMLNFLSYQQTHQASILTEGRYQKAIETIVKHVAA